MLQDVDGAEGVTATCSLTLRSDKRNYDRYLLEEGDLLFQSRGSKHPVAIVGEGLKGIAAAGLHVANRLAGDPEALHQSGSMLACRDGRQGLALSDEEQGQPNAKPILRQAVVHAIEALVDQHVAQALGEVLEPRDVLSAPRAQIGRAHV